MFAPKFNHPTAALPSLADLVVPSKSAPGRGRPDDAVLHNIVNKWRAQALFSG